MGKWAARLVAKMAAPLWVPPAITDKRGVLSALAVPPMGGVGEFQEAPPAALPAANEPARAPAPAHLLDLSAVAWTDGDIGRFIARRARLVRWGWPEADAEALAERLVMRDRSADDERVNCTDCLHYRPGRCSNHRAARLHSPEVGRDLAALLQRCPGFQTAR